MVKLYEGQKIRIEEVGTGKKLKKNKSKIGVIARRYKKYIRIQFEKYMGSLTNADIIAQDTSGLLITVKENGSWIKATKEML